MKVIKRIVLIILILVAAGLIFRGWLYRQLVTYKSVGQRTIYLSTNDDLVAYLNTSVDDNNNLTIEEIIKLALSITSQTLSFTAEKNETNPNSLINLKTAHCVGYASFFATTCNYLLSKYGLANSWTANPHAGQLYFLGVNVHRYFHTPFFKDHDFAIIENKTTGEVFAVDPTVNDYFFIDFVTYAK